MGYHLDMENTTTKKEIKMGKYKVTSGICEGHIFTGYPIDISGEDRIWDAGSHGRSYPAIICIPWA